MALETDSAISKFDMSTQNRMYHVVAGIFAPITVSGLTSLHSNFKYLFALYRIKYGS